MLWHIRQGHLTAMGGVRALEFRRGNSDGGIPGNATDYRGRGQCYRPWAPGPALLLSN